ncbi:MAG: RsmE family RNA methyltransferase [Candidatus Gracilibacteria bacterium]
MHRFFIFQPDVVSDEKVLITSEELCHQFFNVLRFKVGEKIMILDNSGEEYLVELLEISKKEVVGKVLEKRKNNAEAKIKICLYQAIQKSPEKFEMVLQKGTEVGVSEFVPLITKRTERESLHKLPRLERILKESAEQSGRGIIPVLKEPVKTQKLLENLIKSGGKSAELNKKVVHVLAHPEAEKTLKDVSKILADGVEQINVYIGPEGGFTEQEIESAKEAGFILLNVGPRVLRSETAGIVIPALLTFL